MDQNLEEGTDTAQPLIQQELSKNETRNNSYVLRHWRGELPLWKSYWVNGSLVTLASLVLVSFVTVQAANEWLTRFWKTTSIVFILIWVAIYLLTTWQLVGIWRSAQSHIRNSGTFFWARIAQVVLIVGTILNLTTFALVALPQMTEYSLVALGLQKFGGFTVQVLHQGTEMEVAGGMDFGLTEEVKRQLDANPRVTVIHLDSPGGRLAEARSLRQVIQLRGLNTYTSKGCFSACAHAFLAGTTRVIASDARLGFHQAHFPGSSPKSALRIMKEEESYFLSRGVTSSFIKKAFSTPSEKMWTPSPEELLSAHVVTQLYPGEELRPKQAAIPRTS